MNMIDREIGHEDVSRTHSLETAAITGAAFGAFAGLGQATAEAALVSKFARRTPWEKMAAQEEAVFSDNSRGQIQRLLDEIDENHVRTVFKDTVESRAILFGISEGSVVVDATLEACGY